MTYIIAIDGPGGAGKGTIAKKLARTLNLYYLDTGKIYRIIAYKMLEKGFKTDNPDATLFTDTAIELAKTMCMDELKSMQNSSELTKDNVAVMASHVSTIPALRDELLHFQRRVANHPDGAILDGRDIGTVICPQADFKFYITASVEERAQRRYKELKNQNNQIIYNDVLEDLRLRDERDSSRNVAPLRPAEDAVIVDTTHLTVDEVFKKLIDAVRS